MHHVEETDDVHRYCGILAFSLPQEIDSVSINASSKEVLDAEHCHCSEEKIHHFVHHHKVIHLETEVENVVRVGRRVLDLLAEMMLVVALKCVDLGETQRCNDLF